VDLEMVERGIITFLDHRVSETKGPGAIHAQHSRS
jgi:hypothetical protein